VREVWARPSCPTLASTPMPAMHAMITCTLHPAAERLPLAAVQLRWPIAVRQAITAPMLNLPQYSRKVLGRRLHPKGQKEILTRPRCGWPRARAAPWL
jgi:hypothetical protein